MERIRFFIAAVLVSVGAALVVASYAPRPAVAEWVGGVHVASLLFLPRGEMATDRNAS